MPRVVFAQIEVHIWHFYFLDYLLHKPQSTGWFWNKGFWDTLCMLFIDWLTCTLQWQFLVVGLRDQANSQHTAIDLKKTWINQTPCVMLYITFHTECNSGMNEMRSCRANIGFFCYFSNVSLWTRQSKSANCNEFIFHKSRLGDTKSEILPFVK